MLVLHGHSSRVRDVSLSGDGNFVASTDPNTARLWHAATGRCVRVIELTDDPHRRGTHGFRSVHVSLDGAQALAVDGRPRVWDLFSGQPLFGMDEFRDFPDVLVDMPSRRLLSLGADRVVRIWDLDSGQVLHTLSVRLVLVEHARIVTFRGRRTMLLRDQYQGVGLWDLMSAKQVGALPQGAFWGVRAISEASGLVLTGDVAGSVRIWELQTGQCLRTFHGHKGEVAAVWISADGRMGLSVGQDGALRRWVLQGSGYRAPYELSRPRLHRELNDLDAQADLLLEAAQEAIAADRRDEALQMIRRARSLPGKEYAPQVRAAWRAAGAVTRWIGPRAPRQELALSTVSVYQSIALANDRPIAALGGDDIQFWDLESGWLLRSISGHPSPVSTLAFSRDASQLYSATYDGEISLWSVSSGERLRRLESRRTAGASATAFTEDGRLALVGGGDNRVVLWNLANSERLAVLGSHDSMVTSSWISPHGEIGATTGGDGLVRIWDLQSRGPLQTLRGHTNWTSSVCLSTDLQFALSSGMYDDHTLRLWDLATGACVRVFDAMPEAASKVRLTPDDRFAISAGKDGKVRVWDVATGHCLKVFERHRYEVSDLAVSADGWRAVSIANDRTLRVWDLDWDLSAY